MAVLKEARGSRAKWYAVKSGNCEENSGTGCRRGFREVERGVLVVSGIRLVLGVRFVLSVRLVLSWSILKGGYEASNESYSSGAYKKKQCCLVVNMSRKANEQGRFDVVKTRLTTEEERGVRGKGRLYTCCQRLVAGGRDRLGKRSPDRKQLGKHYFLIIKALL